MLHKEHATHGSHHGWTYRKRLRRDSGLIRPSGAAFYADAEMAFFSVVKSQSILIRFSGRVYRSTWNSPSVRVGRLVDAKNARVYGCTYAQRRYASMSPRSCCHAPSGQPGEDHPRLVSADLRPICPCRWPCHPHPSSSSEYCQHRSHCFAFCCWHRHHWWQLHLELVQSCEVLRGGRL